MTQKTTAEDYYQALGERAGTLFYLKRKGNSKEEYLFDSILIDTKNKDLTVRILERTMQQPDFIAFPGTPEFFNFLDGEVGSF